MRSRVLQEVMASCRHVRWLGLYLLLLVAACAPALAVSTITSTANSTMRAVLVSLACMAAWMSHPPLCHGRRLVSTREQCAQQIPSLHVGSLRAPCL
jgi:hypothetical protein